MKFIEFINRKQREAIRHLKVIKKLLESQDFRVTSHLDDDDPHIFVFDSNRDSSFAGIRIYHIGDIVAYRVQNEENTYPYGKAYSLNLPEMFDDLLYDNHDPKIAGKKVIKAVVREVNKFFEKSREAERELKNAQYGWDNSTANPMNKIVVRSASGPGGWSNTVKYNT